KLQIHNLHRHACWRRRKIHDGPSFAVAVGPGDDAIAAVRHAPKGESARTVGLRSNDDLSVLLQKYFNSFRRTYRRYHNRSLDELSFSTARKQDCYERGFP